MTTFGLERGWVQQWLPLLAAGTALVLAVALAQPALATPSWRPRQR